MFPFVNKLLDTSDFPPRWYCGNWSDAHGWLHVGSDLAIAGAYFAIPRTLTYFVLRRKDVPFPPIFWLFACFILSCGIGHAIEATLFWQPWYRLSGVAKLATALASWATVIALVPAIPRALALPGLAVVNQQLKQEIVRREQAEEQRRLLEAQMLQAQKMESLGVLAGGIAHDFNNLLTSILGYAELARESLPTSSSTVALLDQVVSGANRATELTNQMLAYSGKGRFVVQRIDLNELVDSMNRLLRVSISKKHELNHLASAELLVFEADVSQIRQVLMNLVINSSEAIGDQSGIINVRTGKMTGHRAFLSTTYLDENLPEGEYVYLEVSDNGCGMSEETRAKMFDPFFTTKFTGRGLGLAAVLGIIRGHKGAIKVTSESGKGTTFRVLLPAVPSTTLDKEIHPSPEAIPWKTDTTILLVEDEDSVRKLVTDVLQHQGLTIVSATNGREGVEAFRRQPNRFNVVLLDMTMPEMDGEETLRELQKIRPDVKTILMSGYSEHALRARFSEKNLVGFVQKPFRLNDLLNELRKAIEPN